MTGLVAEVQVVVLLALLVVGGVEAIKDNSEGSAPICLLLLQGSSLPAPKPG